MPNQPPQSQQTETWLVDSPEALRRLSEQLRKHTLLAVDTEFVRERTYFPKPCLVQVATDGITACVDVLALENLDPLWRVVLDPAVTKVMHAARQDLEIIYHLTGEIVAPVFDTQIAAGLVGFDAQVAYAQLVAEVLHERLDKSVARTDWAKRPLQSTQIRYAGDDARYLPELYRQLCDRLTGLDRLDWVWADSALLADEQLYRPDPESAWRKVKGGGRLAGSERKTLRLLAAWREQRAIEEDRPRQWVLPDSSLVALAASRPTSIEALRAIDGLPRSATVRYAKDLLEVIARAQTLPADASKLRPSRLTPQERERLDRALELVRARSRELGINPELLATRRELQALARGQLDLPVLRGWRRTVVGERLLEL